MNQIDNDLQKAIDDITNSTNSDPVFSDTVAAPTIPPAANLAPEPVTMEMPAQPAPSTYAPISAMPFQPAMPSGTTMRDVAPSSRPAPIAEPAPRPVVPHAAPVRHVERVETIETITPEPLDAPADNLPLDEPTDNYNYEQSNPYESYEEPYRESAPASSDLRDVKEAALRDLAPLLSAMDVAPDRKINLYDKIARDLHDSSVIPNMYDTIKELPSDQQGDALLNLIDTIDNI